MKWFKHDANASGDAKLKRLRMKYGIEGYGLYWYCLELIAESIDEHNITFELEHDAEIIGFDIGMNHEKVQDIMTYMVKLNLFENKTGAITCFKMAKRLDQSMTSNHKMRNLIQKIKLNHDSVMTQSSVSHDSVMQDKTRLDKIRLEDKDICENSDEISTKSSKQIKIPYQDIVNLYHNEMPQHPRIEKLDETRRSYIKRLWLDIDGIGLPDLQHWENFFTYIKQSKFLSGQTQSGDRKPFTPNLEWVTKPKNYLKITEGFYHG